MLRAAPACKVIGEGGRRVCLCSRQPRPRRRRTQRRRWRRCGHPQQTRRAGHGGGGIRCEARTGAIPGEVHPPLSLPSHRRAQLRTETAQRRAGRLGTGLRRVGHPDGGGTPRGRCSLPSQSQLRGSGSCGAGRHLAVRHLGVSTCGSRICCGCASGCAGGGQGLRVHGPLLIQHLRRRSGPCLRLSQLLSGHILRPMPHSQSDGQCNTALVQPRTRSRFRRSANAVAALRSCSS